MKRPNILYLHVHDLGRYCQPYGYPVPTPSIQKLAEGGIVFRQAFCAKPTCSASRAALLTGQSPHSCGMDGLAHRGWRLYDYKHHVVHTLRRAGYHSALVGVQHVTRDASEIGYDEVVARGKSIERAAARWLRRAPKQPFFLSVGFGTTHREYDQPTPAEDPRWCRPPDPIPDTPQTRHDMACFKASARILDKQFGTVLRALDAAGLARKTLVICTTDHGIAFPHMKCNLTHHGTGVMLILRGPGGFTGGRNCDALISQIDVFPTLCELLKIRRPRWLEGKSFLPIVQGKVDQINDQVFTEVTYHAAYEAMRGVRTKRWSYIRRFDGRSRPVLPNCDDSASKDLWLAHGWRRRPVAEEQLYDLVFDPNEVNNLAGDPKMAPQKVVRDLRRRLKKWMQATNDPLLKGPVPMPDDAIVNPTDGLSPRQRPLRGTAFNKRLLAGDKRPRR